MAYQEAFSGSDGGSNSPGTPPLPGGIFSNIPFSKVSRRVRIRTTSYSRSFCASSHAIPSPTIPGTFSVRALRLRSWGQPWMRGGMRNPLLMSGRTKDCEILSEEREHCVNHLVTDRRRGVIVQTGFSQILLIARFMRPFVFTCVEETLVLHKKQWYFEQNRLVIQVCESHTIYLWDDKYRNLRKERSV